MPFCAQPAQWPSSPEAGKKGGNCLVARTFLGISNWVMPSISVYIIAYNEAAKIEAAVASVLWADEVVVVDSNSSDRTALLAEALGARVVQVPFTGFGELRNRAIEACRHEWIFSLDSDERCTAAARDEILMLLAGQPAHDAYLVPRRSYMMGRWITASGW
jgi:glycosyltransferase involved in cell wall biosynthesis